MNKERYSTAIIILNWNGGDLLKNCVKTIEKYTPKQYKIFIVDNGSTDNSLSKIKPRNNLAIIKNKTNIGFVSGNNQAIKIALKENPKLDYLLLLNNDTKVTKNWFDYLIETINKDKNIGIVGPRQLNFNKKKVNAAGNIKILKNEYFHDKKIREVTWIMGACMLIKKEVFKKIGFLDEIYSPAYYEETDFITRANKANYKTYYCGKSLIYHKGGAGAAQDQKRFSNIFYRNRVIYFLKYNPLGLIPRIVKDFINSIKNKNLPNLLNSYYLGLKRIFEYRKL